MAMIKPVEKKARCVPDVLARAHVVGHADFLDDVFLGVGHFDRHGARDGFRGRAVVDVDGGVFDFVEKRLLMHDPPPLKNQDDPTQKRRARRENQGSLAAWSRSHGQHSLSGHMTSAGGTPKTSAIFSAMALDGFRTPCRIWYT